MPAAHKVPEDHPVRSFLANCDPKAEVYVTHIDSTDAPTRKQQFLMQVGMNILWSLLLARRAYGGLSHYGIRFVLSRLVPRWTAPAPALGMTLLGNIILDFFICMVLLPIVRDFLTGVAALRLRHGFPREEIIFRKPSESTAANIVSEGPEKRDTYMKDLLRRAVDPEEMKQAAFGLPWEEWAYDYKAMAAACETHKKGDIDAKAWELCVWMEMEDGWTAVEQGKEAEMQNQIGLMQKMRVDSLHAMGKLHVFNQMMEVIHWQVKTTTKDGAPLEATEEVDAIVADVFKRNDVDLEKLTSELAKDAPPSAQFTAASKKLD